MNPSSKMKGVAVGSYVTLGANDVEEAHAFYDAVLAEIDWVSHMSFPGWRAYSERGSGEGLVLWVCRPFDGETATVGNGSMVGFTVPTPALVDAFYAVAMENGATDEGAPGHRPQYGETWYAAYLRDPTGNKLAVVYNG